MAITPDSIKYYPELSAAGSDWLLATKYDRIRVEIAFTVGAKIQATTTSRLQFIDYSEITADYIYNLDNLPVFQNFQQGDSITITNTTSNNVSLTIIEKVSDYKIRVSAVVVAEVSSLGTIEYTTPIQGFRYKYGLIENTEGINFDSKIDGGEQQYTYDGLSTTAGAAQDMLYTGNVENETGSATITRTVTGTASGQQQFIIKHTFDVDPIIKPEQLADELNNVAPTYFLNGNALKHVFNLEAAANLTNPNFVQTLLKADLLGDTGYFDRNFNVGGTNYVVSDLIYYRDATSEVIDALELTATTTRIEFTVTNTIDSPFLLSNTKFIPHFSIVPEFDSEFIANGNTLNENFYKDRGLQTAGTAAVVGDNFGTNQQVFTSIESGVSATILTVVLKVTMSATMIADLTARSKRTYNLGFSVQNHLLATAVADKVTLKVDTQDYFIDNSDPTMIAIAPNFLDLTETDFATEGSLTVDAKKEDRIWSEYQFSIDRNTRETNAIDLSKVTFEIIGRKADNTEFTFESYVSSMDGDILVPDPFGVWYNQQFDETETRVYKLPTGDTRNIIELKRRVDLDSGDLRYYSLRYPFVVRFEDWIANASVNTDMFDLAKVENGLNNNWNHTEDITDWNVYTRLKIEATKDGNLLQFEQEDVMVIDTYEENTSWINETIVFKDAAGGTLQASGVDYVLGYADTFVTVTKEYVGTAPAIGDVEWWAHLQVTLGNGSTTMHLLNTMYDYTENSCLRSIDGTNLVKKTVLGNVFTAEFKIDYTLIPVGSSVDVSARIYNNTVAVAGQKLAEDGTAKLIELGTSKIIE